MVRRLLLAALLAATPAWAFPPSPDEVLKATAKADWQPLDPANTLVMQLKTGPVVIALAPDFAPHSVANIKALAHAGYFNNASVVRSQDNYVAQWSQAAPNAKLPPGIKGWAEYERPPAKTFAPLKDADGYAPRAGYDGIFPAASDGAREWLVHCYGTVGVGRDLKPDSGTGAELYAVNGQAPRHLDRNITVVGRVVQGMELLSILPRGTGPLGFYEKPGQYASILWIRLAADLPPGQRPRLEVLRGDSKGFAAYAEARRNRGGPFFIRPAGHIDVCNIPLAVRPAPD